MFRHETGRVSWYARVQGLGLGSCAVPFSGFSEASASVERRPPISLSLSGRTRRVHRRVLALLESLAKLPASAGSSELRRGDSALACERSVGFACPVPRAAFRAALATASRFTAAARQKSFEVLG